VVFGSPQSLAFVSAPHAEHIRQAFQNKESDILEYPTVNKMRIAQGVQDFASHLAICTRFDPKSFVRVKYPDVRITR
jgi:hypothetical protein